MAVEKSIAASPEELWDAISMPGNLELCHPFCAANPVEAWPGDSSRDRVQYLNGMIFRRRFRRWIDGVGYDLEIDQPGGNTSFVSWRIYGGTAETTLSIAVYPCVLTRWPAPIRFLVHRLYVRPMLRKYLQSVVGGFEWYLTTDQAVPRNHFGPHRWFSARRPA